MAHSKQISHAVASRAQHATVAPLATATLAVSRSFPPAVYHVNSRVLLTRLSSLNTVHRSVPAIDGSVIPHRDQYNVVGTWSGPKVALTQSSSLVPSEYAARFMMRQTAKPNIIGLDKDPETSRRRKKYTTSTLSFQKTTHNEHIQDPMSVLGVPKTVAPHDHQEHVATSGADPAGDPGFRSRSRHSNQPHVQLLGTSTAPKLDDYLLEPTQERPDADLNIHSVGYISNNTRMTPRENPWVYRYKVKKNMNQINKILTGKAPSSE
ncbi:hypothetical protein LSH36_454g05027 [Paralvinella palmiformis]|uniref:Uncharacterized protein n=1 Tax=Paralvinella palmiformis TaxID=53620 RepID=A0AAD9JAV8_9ANNE|nr:hypothetical protein LSH36_454g05027 [Paralvinella palmiformis]